MNVYSAAEIAEAAGVDRETVASSLGADRFMAHDEAVRLGRLLIANAAAAATMPRDPFTPRGDGGERLRDSRVPIALSSTIHIAILAAIVSMTTFGIAPALATATSEQRIDPMRLVFLAVPGPGGGGGGGGLRQPAPSPRAQRAGHRAVGSPLPRREPPAPLPAPIRPEPKPPPLAAEPLPPVVAPVVAAPADTRDRVGVLDQPTADADSRGPGTGGGAGRGNGTGLGAGQGTGIGPGSGGGTGGGPYRPGSGIQPPRLVTEIKADYTEEARRRGVAGEVLLEIVVRSNGAVGDMRVLRGLGYGLDERAMQAVRQWRFTPASRLGSPVDVVVEVAVEFKLR